LNITTVETTTLMNIVIMCIAFRKLTCIHLEWVSFGIDDMVLGMDSHAR
jgi:hypothetical protein